MTSVKTRLSVYRVWIEHLNGPNRAEMLKNMTKLFTNTCTRLESTSAILESERAILDDTLAILESERAQHDETRANLVKERTMHDKFIATVHHQCDELEGALGSAPPLPQSKERMGINRTRTGEPFNRSVRQRRQQEDEETEEKEELFQEEEKEEAVAVENLDVSRKEWESERAHMLAQISGLESQCTVLKGVCASRKDQISCLVRANTRRARQRREQQRVRQRREQEEEKEEAVAAENLEAVAVENLDVARKEWESEHARVLARISGLGACTCTHFDLLAQISNVEKRMNSPGFRYPGSLQSEQSELADLRAQLQANADRLKIFGDPLTDFVALTSS